MVGCVLYESDKMRLIDRRNQVPGIITHNYSDAAMRARRISAITPLQSCMLPFTTLVSCIIAVQVLEVVVFTEIQPTVERVVHFPVVAELFALSTRRFDAAASCKQRRTRSRVVLRTVYAEPNRRRDETVYNNNIL